MSTLPTFASLLVTHALADRTLQPNGLFRHKKKIWREPIGIYVLTLHAGIHALLSAAVLMLLGIPWLWPAFVIGAMHWLIDARTFWRGRWWGMADQAVHVTVLLLVSWGTVRF